MNYPGRQMYNGHPRSGNVYMEVPDTQTRSYDYEYHAYNTTPFSTRVMIRAQSPEDAQYSHPIDFRRQGYTTNGSNGFQSGTMENSDNRVWNSRNCDPIYCNTTNNRFRLPRVKLSTDDRQYIFPIINPSPQPSYKQQLSTDTFTKQQTFYKHPGLPAYRSTQDLRTLGGDQLSVPVCRNNGSYGKNPKDHSSNDGTSPKKREEIPLGCSGLYNLGNTCYMNSVLQCLSHTRVLRDYCLQDKYVEILKKKKNCSKGTIIKLLADMLKKLWAGNSCPLEPTEFRRAMLGYIKHFGVDNQEDAQEFLNYLLQGISEDLGQHNLKKKNQSVRLFGRCDKIADLAWKKFLDCENNFITDSFMGQLKSSLKCCSCGYVSCTYDPVLGLSLPIPETDGYSVTLMSCLQKYFQQEILREDEIAECGKCGNRCDAVKCLSVQKFPKVVIIHLKRFSTDSVDAQKISTFVTYPIDDLNFEEFAPGDAIVTYNLYGVVQHVGSLAKGHYTASIKNCNTKKWYRYDDDHVHPIQEKEIVNHHAYILFYELVSATTATTVTPPSSLRKFLPF